MYEAVTAIFDCCGHSFTAKGKRILSEGWREIDRIFRASLKEKPADGDGDTLPDFTEGQTFDGAEVAVTEHFTQPPKPYTEDTLLSAMENAGKDDIPDEAERKGLGTPATRAAIIEKLVAAGFVERKGKSLIPTKAGINLVTVLPEPLTSPMLTASCGFVLWKNDRFWTSRKKELTKKMATDLLKRVAPMSRECGLKRNRPLMTLR